MVQDLRTINEAVISLHPKSQIFTLSLLKFLQIQNGLQCQTFWMSFSAFPFTPITNRCLPLNGQILTLVKLPSTPGLFSIRISGWPHLFGQAIGQNLWELKISQGTILQNVNDLICSLAKQDSNINTILFLNSLGEKGYQVSPSEAQISSPTVKYLGYRLIHGFQSFSIDQKKSHP